jgi:hypothetical protein
LAIENIEQEEEAPLLISFLFEKSVDLNASESHGNTPLFLAMER